MSLRLVRVITTCEYKYTNFIMGLNAYSIFTYAHLTERDFFLTLIETVDGICICVDTIV